VGGLVGDDSAFRRKDTAALRSPKSRKGTLPELETFCKKNQGNCDKRTGREGKGTYGAGRLGGKRAAGKKKTSEGRCI